MKCFIFAGEKSGDMHGAHLLYSLKNKLPELKVTGVFGDSIKDIGYEPLIHMREFHFMGYTAVVKALPKIRRFYNTIVSHIFETNPDLILLVDYPSFNLYLAKKLRKKGFNGKIVHFICPKVWAWKKERIEIMAKTLDMVLCILPFEPQYFSKTSLNTVYIGNPTLEEIENYSFQIDWKKKLGIPENSPILALFPGSRKDEIKKNLPIQIQAAELLKKDFPELIICVSGVKTSQYYVPYEYTYELMKDAKLSFAKSGTTILELALFQTPTVVTYQMGFINTILAIFIFRLYKLPYYSLPNIILNKEVFPELVSIKFTPKSTYEKGKELFLAPRYELCKNQCQMVKDNLKTNTPCSDAGAELITKLLKVTNKN